MGVVYHVHEAFPQKPDLKHLIPAQTASAVPAVLFLPSVHFLPAPSGHPYLAQVPLSLILQFLLQSFSLSPARSGCVSGIIFFSTTRKFPGRII